MTTLKWAKDNEGSIVITDGKVYIGFIEKDIEGFTLNATIDRFDPYNKYEIEGLGINKITDWQELNEEGN